MCDDPAHGSVGSIVWDGLEKHYAHLHLGPVAALFALAEARYDVPAGYHAPPPLAAMVHHAKAADPSLKAMTHFAKATVDSTVADIDDAAVPAAGLPLYLALASRLKGDEAACCGVALCRKLLQSSALSPFDAHGVKQQLVQHLPQFLVLLQPQDESTAEPVASCATANHVLHIVERLVQHSSARQSAQATWRVADREWLSALAWHAQNTASTDTATTIGDIVVSLVMSSAELDNKVLGFHGTKIIVTLRRHFADDVNVARSASAALLELWNCTPSELVQPLFQTALELLRFPDDTARSNAIRAFICDRATTTAVFDAKPALHIVLEMTSSLDLVESKTALAAVCFFGRFVEEAVHPSSLHELTRLGVFQRLVRFLSVQDAVVHRETCLVIAAISTAFGRTQRRRRKESANDETNAAVDEHEQDEEESVRGALALFVAPLIDALRQRLPVANESRPFGGATPLLAASEPLPSVLWQLRPSQVVAVREASIHTLVAVLATNACDRRVARAVFDAFNLFVRAGHALGHGEDWRENIIRASADNGRQLFAWDRELYPSRLFFGDTDE